MITPEEAPTPKIGSSVVLGDSCEDEDCGMQSAFEFFQDGSHRIVMSACWHAKKLPSRARILNAIKAQAHNAPARRNQP